jgi:NADPH-dependent 2,4-dienoyl-CoA reductase/sulfur reductase-like enzyme
VSTDRLVVIGGDAAGLSAASQARRLREASDLEIVVLEQGPEISYSACGIPYWIGGLVSDRDKLLARTPAEFAAKDITVRTDTRAEGIDLDAGKVVAAGGQAIGYDSLVVATGGRPLRPKVPGLDADGVHGVHRLADGADIRAAIAAGAKRAVVLGGGYIGLEMAEAFTSRGLSVTLVEQAPAVMPTVDPELGELLGQELGRQGVRVVNDVTIKAIHQEDGALVVAGEPDFTCAADLALVVVGVRPDTDLAIAAGVQTGVRGRCGSTGRCAPTCPMC